MPVAITAELRREPRPDADRAVGSASGGTWSDTSPPFVVAAIGAGPTSPRHPSG
jgi:hypothetical protein